MKKFLVIASFFLCFFVASERVDAKSVSFVSGPTPLLAYYADCGGAPVCGGDNWWFIGLDSNVLASIGYSVSAYNNKFFVNENSVVSVGSTVTFDGILGEISWYGTGRSMDTPYGIWRENATAPSQADIEQFYTDFSVMVEGGFPPVVHVFSIYIPLSINPPVITYTHTGSTAGLDCNSDGIAEVNPVGANCVVKSAGSILTQVNYDNTYGKFYYKYISSPLSYDYYNKVAMRKATSGNDGGYIADVTVENSDYILPIPAQTISFNLTAVSSNNPPSIPTVTPQPFNGNTNTAYPFTFTSTDPDNDQISYEVDWNNDSLPDQSTSFVASGTPQSRSNAALQWITAGTYSFKVRARDNQGGYSPWTTSSVTLTTIVNGVCGLASGFSFDTLDTFNLALCASGTQTNFLPTGTGWTWGCNGSGGGTSTLPNACTATMKTYILSAVKNLGPSAAGTIIDTTPTAMSIDSAIPRNTESVPYNSSRTLRANPTSSSISWSGCTSVSGNDCIVNNIIADKTVTATFTRLPEPGICGSSNTQSFETLNAGSSGLCSSGAVSGFSLSGTTYSWDCNGSFGSPIDVSCSASQKRNYNWIEVRP
jgi:hypothetical protein